MESTAEEWRGNKTAWHQDAVLDESLCMCCQRSRQLLPCGRAVPAVRTTCLCPHHATQRAERKHKLKKGKKPKLQVANIVALGKVGYAKPPWCGELMEDKAFINSIPCTACLPEGEEPSGVRRWYTPTHLKNVLKNSLLPAVEGVKITHTSIIHLMANISGRDVAVEVKVTRGGAISYINAWVVVKTASLPLLTMQVAATIPPALPVFPRNIPAYMPGRMPEAEPMDMGGMI